MPKSGTSRYKSVLLGLALAFISANAGCGIRTESPAPGCTEYWGLAASGGCQGKTVILDLQVEPQIDCLHVRANNCNGGILDVDNLCEVALTLGEVEIQPGQRSVGLDVAERDPATGRATLTHAHGNFSEFAPAADQSVEVIGTLDTRAIRVRFVKTRPLCRDRSPDAGRATANLRRPDSG
jgi:hypothetical protein